MKLIEFIYLLWNKNLVYNDNNLGIKTKMYLNSNKMNKYINRKCKVIFIDIDNLKYINDKFGHVYGDIIIKYVVNRLKQLPNIIDICRYGGDEFIIITNNRFNDNYLKKIKYISYGIYNKEIGISISKSIEIADKLMYEMKKYKKNKLE